MYLLLLSYAHGSLVCSELALISYLPALVSSPPPLIWTYLECTSFFCHMPTVLSSVLSYHLSALSQLLYSISQLLSVLRQLSSQYTWNVPPSSVICPRFSHQHLTALRQLLSALSQLLLASSMPTVLSSILIYHLSALSQLLLSLSQISSVLSQLSTEYTWNVPHSSIICPWFSRLFWASTYQLSTSSYRLSASSCQFPASSHEFLASSCELSASPHQFSASWQLARAGISIIFFTCSCPTW